MLPSAECERVGVFVASSDNTQDILAQVFPAFRQLWSDCPFEVYIGKNSPLGLPEGCNGVYAPKSDWRSELIAELSQLDLSHVILLLDDFLLRAAVDTARVREIVRQAVDRDLRYVRLRPLQRSLASTLFAKGRRLIARTKLERIPPSFPYYSGLQPAIWRIDHLIQSIERAADIWSFEHVVTATPHFAVAPPAVIESTHVVERGMWLPAASRLFTEVGLPFDPGSRRQWPRRSQLRIRIGEVKFALFGYAGIRLRRIWSGADRRSHSSS